MPSHVHTHKQVGIMALPLDGRFELKTSYARFPPTNQQHPCTYHYMNFNHDACTLISETIHVFCTFLSTFNPSTKCYLDNIIASQKDTFYLRIFKTFLESSKRSKCPLIVILGMAQV